MIRELEHGTPRRCLSVGFLLEFTDPRQPAPRPSLPSLLPRSPGPPGFPAEGERQILLSLSPFRTLRR